MSILASWSGVSPYVGAGVGFAKLGVSGANAYQLAGVAPPAAIVDSVTGATYAFNYGKVLSKNYYNMAWALMAGFGYDINANAKLDIGYRYLNAGTYGALSPVTGIGDEENHGQPRGARRRPLHDRRQRHLIPDGAKHGTRRAPARLFAFSANIPVTDRRAALTGTGRLLYRRQRDTSPQREAPI
jgi:hypothetical protein